MTIRSGSRRFLLIVGLLVVAAGIGGYLIWRTTRNVVDVAAVVALKDRSIGLAENGKYAEADKLLVQLAERAGNEPLVVRNLAIVRLGPLENMDDRDVTDPAKMAELPTPQAVVAAVEALVRQQPNDPVSHLLQSRAARQLARIEPATAQAMPDPLESLQRAVALDQANAAARFELFNLVEEPRYQDNEAAQGAGRKAIAEAYRLSPRNLTLFLEAARSQVIARDAGLKETLSSAEELLKPLVPLVRRKHPTIDIEISRQDAIKAVDENDWGTAASLVQGTLYNLLNSEVVQRTDRLRVDVGALEYLLHDFSEAFYDRHGRPPVAEFAPTGVKFTPASATFPPLADIRDLRLVDVDLDGRLDAAVLHGQTLTVLSRPRGREDWQPLLDIDVPANLRRMLVADLDRDEARLQVDPDVKADEGAKQQPENPSITEEYQLLQSCKQAFPDFVLYGDDGLAIVRNQMAGSLEQTSPTGGSLRKLSAVQLAEELSSIGNVTAAALADFDHDQDLDLVLGVEGKGIQLWRTIAKGAFRYENYTAWSSLPDKPEKVSDLAIVDWDRDLYIDIVAAFETLPPVLLANQRHGQFLGRELDKEFASLAGASAIAPIELDGNVSWDLAAVAKDGVRAILTSTPTAGKVTFLKELPAAKGTGQRLRSWDYDNDTCPDLLVWGNAGMAILRGTPEGWRPLGASSMEGLPTEGLVAIDFGDLDGDHDLDLIAATANELVLVTNDGGSANHSLLFFVTGDFNDNQRIGSNNSAVGASVETRTTGRYQAQVITRQPVHIGLGAESEANLVRLIFTNGIPRSAATKEVPGLFCERQILFGSCPFIYCWDGHQFAFFSDCLWAAPIGMQVAEGQMAPSRAWEYLLIPGDRLKERDGSYDLQLTEELWEATYFDEVKLIAVDHPEDTDLYTNEKVGGPDIAAPKLYLVKAPRRPVAARDKHGRDVLETVVKRDDVYFRGFDQHVTQGLVDEHYLELDLGELDAPPKHVTLFLTGWIYPTNTSINVNLSQDPRLAYPRHPYIQVPDGAGNWKEVQAFMGFPGGKTKTIAVELPGEAFSAGIYQVRIGTSAEIYWDDVFFTVNEEPTIGSSPYVKEQALELVAANLHYRGFSRELPRHPHAPLRFDYQTVTTEPKWPPMDGFFTRFGDVQPLLTAADDRMVVVGAGDEMTVRFRVPDENPPVGWKRDFILHSVGWDKDADLNTVYGQTAEPLPHNAMPSYPYPAGQWYPDTHVTREYLQKYQTRRQDSRRFWRALSP